MAFDFFPQDFETVHFFTATATGGPNTKNFAGPFHETGQDMLFKDIPDLPVPEKTADGYGHEAQALFPQGRALVQGAEVFLHGMHLHAKHVATHPLFDALSHPSVAGPGEIEIREKPSKLFIIHGIVPSGNKRGPDCIKRGIQGTAPALTKTKSGLILTGLIQ